MKIPIICPSYGRAKNVKCTAAIAGITLAVHENERDEYVLNNPGTAGFATHKIKGLGQTRQWIYNEFGSVFMVDDDITNFIQLHRPKDHYRVDPKDAYEIIQATGNYAHEAGAKLWGFNQYRNSETYKGFSPFKLTGYINGCGLGMHPSKNLWFSRNIYTADSHWISALNAHHNRIVFIDQRFHVEQAKGSTLDRAGGQSAYRTMETERKDTEFLIATFGDAFVSKQDLPGAKLIHQHQRTLKIPF